MKKIVLLAFLVTLSQANESYSGCGETHKEAIRNLSNNILVKVDSSVDIEASSSSSWWGESVSKDVIDKSSQSSKMVLPDLENYFNEESQPCVRVSKEDLKRYVQNNIDDLSSNYDVNDLPSNPKQQAKTIDNWLSSLTFLGSLAEAFSDIKKQSLNQIISTLEDKRTGLALQYVKVNVHGSKANKESYAKELFNSVFEKTSVLEIDNTKASLGEENFLKAGDHTLQITGPHCTVSQTFHLDQNNDKTITINLDDYAFPTLVVSANKSNVSLQLNGLPVSLNQTKTFSLKECDSTVKISLTYSDGEPNSVTDELEVTPGMSESLSYDFTSNQEIQELSQLAQNFQDGNRIELMYNYTTIDPSVDNAASLQPLQQFGAPYLSMKNWLRHGYRAYYSIGEKESYAVEATYLLAYQLTTFGAKKRSLRLGNVVTFIPYLGVELGAAYSSIYNETTDEYQSLYQAERAAELNDFRRYFMNYAVVKPLVGVDFVFSEEMAIGFEFSKMMTMHKSYNAGFHISLKL